MHLDLTGEWYGYRLRGHYLISPDGDRMTPERLRGLLWRDHLELRRAGFASRQKAENAGQQSMVTVVRIDQADWHRAAFGSGAG